MKAFIFHASLPFAQTQLSLFKSCSWKAKKIQCSARTCFIQRYWWCELPDYNNNVATE